MRKMRSSDDGSVGLDLYLCCKKQRNNPRIHHKVCEDTCRYLKKCPDYNMWREKNIGGDAANKKEKKKKVVRRRKSKPKRKAVGGRL